VAWWKRQGPQIASCRPKKIVNPISGELPYDSVGNVFEGVDVPKLGKLSDMHFT
jgi:hypothetical protein